MHICLSAVTGEPVASYWLSLSAHNSRDVFANLALRRLAPPGSSLEESNQTLLLPGQHLYPHYIRFTAVRQVLIFAYRAPYSSSDER